MRKIITLFLVICITLTCFSFVACSNDCQGETKIYYITQNVNKIVANLDNAGLNFAITNERPYVEYHQCANRKFKISENNAIVTIKELFLISFGGCEESKITVYLNADWIADIKLDCEISIDNGSVFIENYAFDLLKVQLDNGSITLKNSSAENCVTSLDNGAVEIDNLITNTLLCDVDVGNVNAEYLNCLDKASFSVDVGNLYIQLKGSKEDFLITAKIDMGKCNVSSTITGQKQLNLSADVGNIEVRFYDIFLKTK